MKRFETTIGAVVVNAFKGKAYDEAEVDLFKKWYDRRDEVIDLVVFASFLAQQFTLEIENIEYTVDAYFVFVAQALQNLSIDEVDNALTTFTTEKSAQPPSNT